MRWPMEKLAPFHTNIPSHLNPETRNFSFRPSDRCFLVTSLPLARSFRVARKDVVAGELPAAATTQVQDGRWTGERRHMHGRYNTGCLGRDRFCRKGMRPCNIFVCLSNSSLWYNLDPIPFEHPAYFFKIGGESGREGRRASNSTYGPFVARLR